MVLATSGCATLRSTFTGYATGPQGISRPQQRLREALASNDFSGVLGAREDDALLKALNTGIASYYASQFARSAATLDTAALLADDRITASLSKDALALLTNDMARPYQPRRTERLFIPYYGMLAYARLGQWEDAAVEARRLVGLLALYGNDRDEGERALFASLDHLAGAVFERAGNRGEAEVAYRNAHALVAAYPDSVASHADEGELLVVVERGFVAHRASESLNVFLGDDDRDSLRMDGEPHRRAVARIVERGGWGGGGRSDGRGSALQHWPALPYRSHGGDDDDDDYWLKVAFPALRRSARPWGGAVRLATNAAAPQVVSAAAMLDDASAADERRERSAFVARAVARAATKYAVTKAVKDKKGELAGGLANLGVNLLERADVRSWHLLPQEISLLRVRVRAGTRDVRVEVGEGASVRTVELGAVTVRSGEVAILPVRFWRDPVRTPGKVVATSAGDACDAIVCR